MGRSNRRDKFREGGIENETGRKKKRGSGRGGGAQKGREIE